MAFQPGDGPRHFAFHPSQPLVFVVNEKGSSVATMKYDSTAGTLVSLGYVSTVPPGSTMTTLMPSGAVSAASTSEKPSTPNFEKTGASSL